MCFSAILIAISVILANFPIFSSIALDSMPAFVGGIIISPVVGGIIGLLAHLFVALRTGFPLSLPVHILVALEMFVVVYITSIIFNKGKVILAGIVGTLLNGIGFTFITGVFMYFVLGGMNPVDFLKLLGLPLTLASLVNIVIAFIVSKGLKMQIYKFRDLTILENEKNKLVIACDSCGGIGENEGDFVKAENEIVSYFSARVCLLSF